MDTDTSPRYYAIGFSHFLCLRLVVTAFFSLWAIAVAALLRFAAPTVILESDLTHGRVVGRELAVVPAPWPYSFDSSLLPFHRDDDVIPS
jgi:hypothetical protein